MPHGVFATVFGAICDKLSSFIPQANLEITALPKRLSESRGGGSGVQCVSQPLGNGYSALQPPP